jgi:eukaryotic-like serine/threonine-protein kinase
MPLAESTLHKELVAGRAGDRDWVVHVFPRVLEGMAHAHGREVPVLHRDLKPMNVLFVRGVAKVADFGLGKLLSPDATALTQTWEAMGSAPYMSPEQFSDAKHVGPPSDVYALGKVLWEMLAGTAPDVLWVDLSAIPAEFRYFVDRCCRRDPAERFQNASEALEAFSAFTAGPGILPPPLEGAEKLLEAWESAGSDADRMEVLRRLDEHLQRNRNDEELYRKVLPRLPDDLVARYMDELGDRFKEALRAFDEHVSGGLPFSYCDVVADFYAGIWSRTEDVELRRLVLARLIEMGAWHNRWYVGGVVARLLASIDDVGTAMLAAEVIESNPQRAEWFWDPWVKEKALMQPIGDAFARVTAAA